MIRQPSALAVAMLLSAAAAFAQPTSPPPQGPPRPSLVPPALLAVVEGRQDQPAETVFKNIQALKGMPAGRLLRVMEAGYARSLGVECTHCHVAGAWESDEKREKQVARAMIGMTAAINTGHLRAIPGLKGPDPVVNCTTCHRGQIKPALSLEPVAARPAAARD